MKILIVEDEKKIAQIIKKGLLQEGYSVDLAFDGEEALEKYDVNEYDLVVLDLMLPKLDGLSVCKEIRSLDPDIPVLMLTAKDSMDDKVLGLDSGADDYMTKPFSFDELFARVRALLRRGKKADMPILSFLDLFLDPSSKTVKRSDKTINLTSREFALLEYFMRNPNRVLTKTQILEHVWDCNYDGFSNIVETYVKYLRKKLRVNDSKSELIFTVRGSGYILKAEEID